MIYNLDESKEELVKKSETNLLAFFRLEKPENEFEYNSHRLNHNLKIVSENIFVSAFQDYLIRLVFNKELNLILLEEKYQFNGYLSDLVY